MKIRYVASNLHVGLERLDVVHAGPETFPLGERVRAVSMRRLLTDLQPL